MKHASLIKVITGLCLVASGVYTIAGQFTVAGSLFVGSSILYALGK